jgi:hypothetical protein
VRAPDLTRLLLPLLLLSLVSCACADLTQANTAYQAGDFQSAQQAYLAQLAATGPTVPLLYNLGNTCLRLQQVGWALVYYQRALLVAPRDPDLRTNLALALAARQASGETLVPGWLSVLISAVVDRCTINELTGAFLLVYLLTAALAVWWLRSLHFRRRYRWLFTAALLLTLLFAGLTLARWTGYHDPSRGLVVASGNMLSGPADSFPVVRKVFEGESIELGSLQGTWREVHSPTGATGWVIQSMVEPIIFPSPRR